MKTLIELDDADVEALDALAAQAKRSRSALIREAIGQFLKSAKRDAGEDGFGLWGQRKVDGLTYQKKIRSEW